MNTANRILDELYFITITVMDCADIFTRPKIHIILDSLAYCWHSADPDSSFQRIF